MSDWVLTACCCQNSHGPGSSEAECCRHWGRVLWFGCTPLGLWKTGHEKSYRKVRCFIPMSTWERPSKAYSWSKTIGSVWQRRVCHHLLKTGCGRRVVTAECRNKYHPTLFHWSCLSFCIWINLVGQRVSKGVDGITLLVTLVHIVCFW